ncbi:MAG: 30S ribosomal protein S6 [Mycoplasmataceae bacterium]|jgi:small subunit ribosomal protein S6|nr:30S ribosomal protein S6 [Mycoplasmataceae bacterium]
MPKYEIMLLVDGSLDKKNASSSISDLVKTINKSENFKLTELGLKDMAYIINGQNKAWYFQYNFETNIPNDIAEFRRLALINKSVLRHLIINLEKDYGHRAINNAKKVKISKMKAERFKEKQAKMKAEHEAYEKAHLELDEIKKEVTHE